MWQAEGVRVLKRMGCGALTVGLTLIVNAVVAFGFGGGALEVAQPLISYEGIEVSRVSYVMGRPFSPVPGYNVYLIGEPSCVCNDQGNSVNLNAANLLGIRAGYDPYHGATSMLHGDTLHVYVDLSGLKPLTEELRRKLRGWSAEAVINATVECILLTAYDCRFGMADQWSGDRVEARYVWLEVKGPAKYDQLRGVFSFEQLGLLPRKRLFN
jgi:hypothetical protein